MEKIIFIHIPKTGGSTLTNILFRQYGKRFCFAVGNDREAESFHAQTETVKAKTKVLCGHMAFGHHVAFDSLECRYITMLRHPVDRIISNFYFIQSRPHHYLHKELVGQNYSLSDYVSSGIVANAENAQVRLLGQCISRAHNGCTLDDLNRAKANVQNLVTLAGTTDLFDHYLVLAKELLNWKQPYYFAENITTGRIKRVSLDLETEREIIKYNALDLELYNCVRNQFLERWDVKREHNEQRLRSFRSKNLIYGKLIQIKRTLF